MDVNVFNAARGYGAAQKLLTPAKPQGEQQGQGFSPQKAVSELAGAVAKSESASAAFVTGKADPHSVVEALASAELAVETAVTLRNRVVEAYQELLRMPV
ncbi:MAG: flagellar hook-basal body complex protein FliE [Parvularculaceae bacterium]|nr:flagellar hook-basal body complex protein FliE [Parvularculaceae bacterium]